jgi:hypothetical protein
VIIPKNNFCELGLTRLERRWRASNENEHCIKVAKITNEQPSYSVVFPYRIFANWAQKKPARRAGLLGFHLEHFPLLMSVAE